MITRLYNALATVSIATLIALAGFVGYLVQSEKLSASRLETVASVLRGELDGTDEEVGLDATADVASAEATAGSQPSAQEVRKQRRGAQLRRAALARARRDVQSQQELLDQALQDLISKQETFDDDRASWTSQQAKLKADARDAGFERELALVSKLSPRKAKEHLVMTWKKRPADAVRLLNALKTGVGQRILDQMRTSEEMRIMHELLEQLRNKDVDTLISGSGTTSQQK